MSSPAVPPARLDGAVVWEEVPCPLCGASEEQVLIEAVAPDDHAPVYRVVRCRVCGMGYLNPRPDVASIGRYYPDEYECYQAPTRAHAGPWARLRKRLEQLALARELGHPPALTRWHERALALLGSPLLGRARNSLTGLPYLGEGRMLDFGCGGGWYLERMRQQGWSVTGLDFSAHAAEQVRARYGIPVLVGSLPHAEVRPESFDLITMGCVLEHVHQPHAVIAAAAEALRPGGALVISVPNIASWGFQYFGPDWWPLELPRHLLHFTPPTLRALVEAHGLEVAEERMLERGSWMRRSFGFVRQRRGGARQLLASLSRLRIVPGLLTKWTVRRGQADGIMLRAHRPERRAVGLSRPPVPYSPAA